MQRDKLVRVVSTLLQREPEWIVTPTVEHDAILDAREAGDPEAADRAMTAYLERGKGSCAGRCRRGLIVSRACGSNTDRLAGRDLSRDVAPERRADREHADPD